MQSQDARFSGSIPEYYDRGLGPVIIADFADEIAGWAAASRPDRVLETAAGTGIVTRRLRDLLPSHSRLTATDLNQPMLEVARVKFRPGERVEFEPADATTLPYPDAAFDAVVCQFGVMFFPDKEKAYREVHRVLAPGGRYMFSVWDSHRRNRFAQLNHEVIGSFFPDDPPQFYRLPFAYHQIDPVKEALTDAGFSDIRIAVLRRDKEIADLGSFAKGQVYGNPVIDQIRARGDADPDRIVEAVAAALRHEFGADPCRISLQAIVYEAVRP